MNKQTPDEQKRILEKHVASSTDQKPLPTEGDDKKPKISFEDQMKLMDARRVEAGVPPIQSGDEGGMEAVTDTLERLIALIEELPDALANRFGVD